MADKALARPDYGSSRSPRLVLVNILRLRCITQAMPLIRVSSIASLATASALLVAALAAPSEASARPTTLPEDAAHLPRGTATHVPHIVGTTLDTGRGVIRLPALTKEGDPASYGLLGNSPRGWVVVSQVPTDHPQLMLVTGDGEATVFHTASLPADEPVYKSFDYRLSDDRTRVLELLVSPTRPDIPTVLDLDGTVLDSLYPIVREVLDFSGPLAILSRNGQNSLAWTIGGEHTSWGAHANFVDLGRGTQSVEIEVRHGDSYRRTWAFTRLATPKRVLWTALFKPLRTSPDGRLVYGNKVTTGELATPGIAQIRRVSDGKVVTELHGRFLVQQIRNVSQWQGSRAILIQRPLGAHRSVIVRCTLNGRCTRAGASYPRAHDVSFPSFP